MTSIVTTTQETQDITGHIFTLCAGLSLGIGVTELASHIRDDFVLLSEWRWANISYFGARWCGLLTMAGYIALASIGHISTFSQCHGVFVFSHVFCAFNSVFSASIFWTRCGALCHWNRYVVIPLAMYGIGISAFALASSADDFAFKPKNINSTVCIVSMKSMSQSVSRFLFASFDLMVAVVTFYALWYKLNAESWISRHLIRDQLIYITVTMTAYLGLASSFLLTSPIAAGFGLLCPSVISVVSCRLFLRLKRRGKDNHRNKTFHDLDAFDQRGIRALFKSSSPSPSSRESQNKSIDKSQEEKDIDHKSILQGIPVTVTVHQSSSTTQLITKRKDQEDRDRSASLSESLLSHCRARVDDGKLPKKRESNISSHQSSSFLTASSPSDVDIERCQEILQGDQHDFPKCISPPRPSFHSERSSSPRSNFI